MRFDLRFFLFFFVALFSFSHFLISHEGYEKKGGGMLSIMYLKPASYGGNTSSLFSFRVPVHSTSFRKRFIRTFAIILLY